MGVFTVAWQEEVAVIRMDDPNDKVNTLGPAILEELPGVLDQLSAAKAIVLISGKEDCFIAGADIQMFADFEQAGEAQAVVRRGQQLLDRIAAMPVPVIAAIRGPALGGGLEVALACHFRICADDPKTVLGLPEVKLGLLPGLGGTQRLPRQVGLQKALDLLLTGKNVYPRKAKKIGLVDQLIHPHGLEQAALQMARKAISGKLRGNQAPKSLLTCLLEGNPLGRALVYRMARRSVLAKTAGHYPAPVAILDTVKHGLARGLEKGLVHEAEAFDRLVRTPESQALVQLFFAMTAARKNPAKNLARPVNRLGILGAGLMGAGIAEVTLPRDIRVFIKDVDAEALGRGEKTVWKSLDKGVKRRIRTSFERDRLMALLHGTLDMDRLRKADVVIEAVFEDLALKRRMLADVEQHCPDHCIFASNTSSLPIAQIAAEAARPGQVIGMHYFSPVAKMPLLEIVVTDQTHDWVIATATQLGIDQGKHIIVVKDGPGFYTTRILGPMLNEAVVLLEEDASVEAVDKAMLAWGFPVGPLKLMDEVGIDVGSHVGSVLEDMFTERTGHPPTHKVRELYEAGYKGRKNGKGFYRYQGKKGGQQVNSDIYRFFGGSSRKSIPLEDIQARLSLIMVNEAAWCLQEGILAHARDGDLGAILGLGFPPFRGGPFYYMNSEGTAKTADRMAALAERHGPRFQPASIIGETRNFQVL